MTSSLSITSQGGTARRVWTLDGDLDLEAVGTAAQVLWAEATAVASDAHLVLDQVRFIGFAGVDLLVDLARHLPRATGSPSPRRRPSSSGPPSRRA